MRTESGGAPLLLIVEADQSLQTFFTTFLTQEGYAVACVASLEEAFQRVDEQVFALVLAEVFLGNESSDLQRAQALRAYIYPIPLAVLTRLPLPATDKQTNFAFALPMPFNLEECLGLIASTLNAPLDGEHQRQSQIVSRLVKAIEERDWEGLAELHTEDVICVPPAYSRGGLSSRWFQGKAAFRVWAEGLFRRYTALHVSEVRLAATPRGLAIRFTMHWQTPEGPMQRAGTLFLRFRGQHICQVGIRIPLPPLPGEPALPSYTA